jgi:peptide/nickel transport system substrate-binding protein
MKRTALPLIGAALLLVACSHPGSRGTDSRPASERSAAVDSVVLLGPGDSFRPESGSVIRYLVFLTLVERNEDGELVGRLARDWSFDAQRDEWTVHLRSDVRWQDGVPVTTRDVAFTLDLYSRPADPSQRMVPPEAFELRVLDDSTYTIRLFEGSDPETAVGTPRDWYVPIYPAHLLQDLDRNTYDTWEFWDQPVGNGPYRVVRRIPDRAVFLEANPDFYPGAAAVEHVTVMDQGTGLVELLAGTVDAAPIEDADLSKLEGDGRFDLYHTFNPYSVSAVLWNHSRGPLGDPRVRRALTLAIDRRAIFQLLNAPPDFGPVDGLFTARQFTRGELPAGLEHDPEAARALLEEAGWRDEDGDGIRERDGETLSLSLLAPRSYGPWLPDHTKEAVAIQEHLRRVGVRAEVRTQEGSVAFERLMAGDFDAIVADIKPGSRSTFFGPESILGYRNPELIRLLEGAGRTFDPDALDALYAEIGEIMRADLPVTLLMPMLRWTAAHRRLKGLSSPWWGDPAWVMGRLWIEDAER